jgi:hypothetical protein
MLADDARERLEHSRRRLHLVHELAGSSQRSIRCARRRAVPDLVARVVASSPGAARCAILDDESLRHAPPARIIAPVRALSAARRIGVGESARHIRALYRDRLHARHRAIASARLGPQHDIRLHFAAGQVLSPMQGA